MRFEKVDLSGGGGGGVDDDVDGETSFDLTTDEGNEDNGGLLRKKHYSFLPPATTSTRNNSPPTESHVSLDGLIFEPNNPADLLLAASAAASSQDGEITRAQVAQLQLVLADEKKAHQRTRTDAEQEKYFLASVFDQVQRSLLIETNGRTEMATVLTSEEEAHVDTKKQRDAALAQVKVLESKVEAADARLHASMEKLAQITQHQERVLKLAEERASVAELQTKEALARAEEVERRQLGASKVAEPLVAAAAAAAAAPLAQEAAVADHRPEFDVRVHQHLSNRLADTLVPKVQGRRASQLPKRASTVQNSEEFTDAVLNVRKEGETLNELDLKIGQLFEDATVHESEELRRSLPGAAIKDLYLQKNEAWRELAIAISHEAHARIKQIETLRDIDMQQIGYLVGLEHTGGPTMISTPPPPPPPAPSQ